MKVNQENINTSTNIKTNINSNKNTISDTNTNTNTYLIDSINTTPISLPKV